MGFEVLEEFAPKVFEVGLARDLVEKSMEDLLVVYFKLINLII